METRYLADCSACGWESPAADLAEVAADLGLEHLTVTHPGVLSKDDVSYIRIWEFMIPAVPEPEPTPGPPPPPPPPAASPEKRASGHEAKHETARRAGRKRG